jgi:hypothetical protein
LSGDPVEGGYASVDRDAKNAGDRRSQQRQNKEAPRDDTWLDWVVPPREIRVDVEPRLLLDDEWVDFVGDPVILDQHSEQYAGEQQNPTVLGPRKEGQLERDIHEVCSAVTDIRQESENDEDE